jgi:hypothetical protein
LPYFAFGCALEVRGRMVAGVKWVTVVLCGLSLPGCATMFRGDRQPVRFVSDPPGAQVDMATGQPTWCRTPCTIGVKRSQVPAVYTAGFSDRQPLTAELRPVPEAGIVWLPIGVFDQVLIVPGMVDQVSETFLNYPTDVTIALPPNGRGTVQVSPER